MNKDNELDKLRGIFALHESFASDEEYNASNCFSYSVLKDLHDNPEVLTETKEETEKEWFTFGTIVDLMLTAPEDIEKKIFVNDKVPSEQFKNIADFMVTNGFDLSTITEENINSIYDGANSSVKWLPATKLQKVKDECGDYLKLITDHKDKIIVTTELFLEATKIAETFKTHPWSHDLFLSEEVQETNHIEIFYQYKMKYIYEGLLCKSKLDVIVIDHDQRLISPFDIKTGHDSMRSFITHALYKYKYGYQGTLYKEGLTRFVAKIPELKDYEIDNFRFVYVSRQKPTFPVTLEMSDICHSEFKDLGIDTPVYWIPSLSSLIREANYYINIINEGKIPTIPFELIRNNGVIVVDALDISSNYVF